MYYQSRMVRIIISYVLLILIIGLLQELQVVTDVHEIANSTCNPVDTITIQINVRFILQRCEKRTTIMYRRLCWNYIDGFFYILWKIYMERKFTIYLFHNIESLLKPFITAWFSTHNCSCLFTALNDKADINLSSNNDR